MPVGRLSHLDGCSQLLAHQASALPHLLSTAGLSKGAWPSPGRASWPGAAWQAARRRASSGLLPRRSAPLLHQAPRLTLGFLH